MVLITAPVNRKLGELIAEKIFRRHNIDFCVAHILLISFPANLSCGRVTCRSVPRLHPASCLKAVPRSLNSIMLRNNHDIASENTRRADTSNGKSKVVALVASRHNRWLYPMDMIEWSHSVIDVRTYSSKTRKDSSTCGLKAELSRPFLLKASVHPALTIDCSHSHNVTFLRLH